MCIRDCEHEIEMREERKNETTHSRINQLSPQPLVPPEPPIYPPPQRNHIHPSSLILRSQRVGDIVVVGEEHLPGREKGDEGGEDLGFEMGACGGACRA